MNQTVERMREMRGRPVVSREDEKIGDFEGVYLDEPTGEPRWVAASIPQWGGLMGSKYYLVPFEKAQVSPGDQTIRVAYSKETVEHSPEVDGSEISPETEEQIYEHYDLALAPTDTDVAPDRGVAEGEATIERREEEMRVGKRETARGRVRLHKWVETEPVEENVDLRRETAHVERQAVDRPAPGAQIGEEEAEMTLHEEEPVVEKETRTKEEVRLEREVEEHQETVRGEVRKERVEADEDIVPRP